MTKARSYISIYIPLQLGMLYHWVADFDSTNRGRTHFHAVNTFLLLDNLPDFVTLGAGENDLGASIWSIPAVLSILVLQGNAVATAQPLAISRQRFINSDDFNTCKIAHAGVSTTLLGLLGCLGQEAVLVCVFAAVRLHTAVLERSKDRVWPIILGEVFLMFGELRFIVVKLSLG